MARTTSATPWGILMRHVTAASAGGSARRHATALDQLPARHDDTHSGQPALGLLWTAALGQFVLLAVIALSPAGGHSGDAASLLPTMAGTVSLSLALGLTGVLLLVSLRARDAKSRQTDDDSAPMPEQLEPQMGSAPLMVAASAPREPTKLGNWAELSARVGHEVRTPLNAVIGYTDVMHRELLGPVGHARYREYLGHIHASSRALLAAAEDTLAITELLADPKPGLRSQLQLEALLLGTWQRLADHDVAEGIALPALTCRVAADVAVLVDPRAFQPALLHVLRSARWMAGPTGRLAMTADVGHGEVVLRIQVMTGCDDGAAAARAGCAPPSCNPWIASGTSEAATQAEFPLCLARALLDLQDTALHQSHTAGGCILSLRLEHASQQDLLLGAMLSPRPNTDGAHAAARR